MHEEPKDPKHLYRELGVRVVHVQCVGVCIWAGEDLERRNPKRVLNPGMFNRVGL